MKKLTEEEVRERVRDWMVKNCLVSWMNWLRRDNDEGLENTYEE